MAFTVVKAEVAVKARHLFVKIGVMSKIEFLGLQPVHS